MGSWSVNPERQILSKIEKVGGHWLWTGAMSGKYGARTYGRIIHQGKPMLAHRRSYELFVGPIPEGMVLDHLCRVTRCVNPDHLEPVTSQENTRRGLLATNAVRTVCKNGLHDTTIPGAVTSTKGGELCTECLRANRAATRRRFREAHPDYYTAAAIAQRAERKHA